MNGERVWVETVRDDIEKALTRKTMIVETGRRLPYAVHVSKYQGTTNQPVVDKPHGYQTDLLISERLDDGEDWTPRVVVEFKLRSVTTHDALTYSAKAATHKNVHPYLRYGIVVGNYAGPVPRRLVRHGHQFDFMLTLPSRRLTDEGRNQLVRLLRAEVRASQRISLLLSGKSNVRLVHRMLALSSE
jgi:hypothetical protein